MVVTEDRYWDCGFSSPDFYKMSVEYVQASMSNGDNIKLHAAGVIGGNRTKSGYELKPIQGSPFHQDKYIDAPDIIVVSWFSYAEQKFYAVKKTFNDVAKKTLKTPYYAHYYRDNSIKNFKNHIVIGLAPGGYVTV
jgi:hypothetical protein